MMTVLSVIGTVLLWILIGIGCLLGLVILLLCVPVHLLADYEDTVKLKLRYGLIPIQLLPAREKTEAQLEKAAQKKKEQDRKKQLKKEEKKKQKSEQPKKTLQEILEKYGGIDHLPDTLPELLGALAEACRTVDGLRRCLIFRKLRVVMLCGGADAAQAAISYGRAWPILTAAEQTLRRVFRVRHFEGTAQADFTSQRDSVQGELHLKLTPIRLVGVILWRGIKILRRYLRILSYGKGAKRRNKTTGKAGAKHEQPDS